MKIISLANSEILRNIGIQTYQKENEYKLIEYHVIKKVEAGVLIYNTLTREILLLENNEYDKYVVSHKDSRCFEYLVQHWFYIPNSMSANTLAYLLHQRFLMRRPSLLGKTYNMFTIFTTTTCNARCFYCYESGSTQKSMNYNTAIDVAEYIKNNSAKTIQLKWFGGEPLCNTNAIDTISTVLKENNIDFSAVITTNGILAGKIDKEKWIDLWHIKRVQITLDGTQDTYNTIKSYQCKLQNPFMTVLDNIDYLLDMGIYVHIRTTLTKNNYNDIIELISLLKKRFGKKKNLLVYSALLYEGCGTPPTTFTDDERNILYGQLIQLQKQIRKLGLCHSYSKPKLNISHCMADNGQSLVILPDGNLTICEHHCDDEICGSIYENTLNNEIIQSYRVRRNETDKCADCFFYPQCITLKKCPTDPICCDGYIRYKKDIIETMMVDTYNRYLKENTSGLKNE